MKGKLGDTMNRRSLTEAAASALVVVILVAGLSWQFNESLKKETKTPEVIGIGTPTLGPGDIKNPEIARYYHIVGYVEFNTTENTSAEPRILAVVPGKKAEITIFAHFVSYDPEVKEVQLTIDPKSSRSLTVEKCYVITDEKGNVIEEGTINLNKLVSYDVSGVVSIPAGETLKLTLTIQIPPDFPKGVNLPVAIVGVDLEYPQSGVELLDNIKVMVRA